MVAILRPATSISCFDSSCCNITTSLVPALPSGVLWTQIVLSCVFVFFCVCGWIVLRCCYGTPRRKGPRLVARNEDQDGYNSQGEMQPLSSINGREDLSSQHAIVPIYMTLYTITTLVALVELGFLFLPTVPVARVVQILWFRLKEAVPLFVLSLLFWREWTSLRSLILSLALSATLFGLSSALSIAVSRAVASSTGAPHIDIVICTNCPLFFFDVMTVFSPIFFTVVWTVALVLLVRKRLRSSGTPLVVTMLIYNLLALGTGAAISADLVPEGLCGSCVVQFLFVLALPIILAVTAVLDSRFALEEAPGAPLSSSAISSFAASPSPKKQTAGNAGGGGGGGAGERQPLLRVDSIPTEKQRIAKYLLDNLDESVRVVEFDQVIRERKIGAGGFGEVFRGTLSGEEIAIKRVLDMDERKAKTFLREINIMSRLQHPNIVVLVGVAISEDDCFLLTEYVKRGSLFDIIHSKRKRGKTQISWANVITVLRGTVVGMAYLHAMDPPFLHRDLKSQNLLIGDHWLVKICDFGMARVRSLGVTMTKLGTLQWVAPEILREERYTEKADVYSFAILIWELVARAVPYVGQNSLMVARAVAYKGLRPEIPAYCPDVFRDLMMLCWTHEPEKRPMFSEILNILDEIPAEAHLNWEPVKEQTKE